MSKYEQMMEQLDYAIEVGCDYQFLEELKAFIEELHESICTDCVLHSDTICGNCKWQKS